MDVVHGCTSRHWGRRGCQRGRCSSAGSIDVIQLNVSTSTLLHTGGVLVLDLLCLCVFGGEEKPFKPPAALALSRGIARVKAGMKINLSVLLNSDDCHCN